MGLLARREGSSDAKRRLALLLETLSGKRSVSEAAEELGLSEAMVHRLRDRVLEAALEALEPRPRGRPAQLREIDAGELERLRERNARLERDCKAAEVRAELAAVLPGLKKNGPTEPPAGSEAAGEAPEQLARRASEREAKKKAVGFKHWAERQGAGARSAAESLKVPRRTLEGWEEQVARGPVLRGRPPKALDPQGSRRVEAQIERLGPTIGLEPLKALFPEVSRRELGKLLRGYRERYSREHARERERLEWLVPGAAWAMDHTAGPQGEPILQIRDLATRSVLLWLRSRASGQETRARFESVAEAAGLPLVVKSDNGSAFIAQEVRGYLEARGVTLLLSPPRSPRYNGAIEASMRWLKQRTEHQARRLGTSESWSPQALERARRASNALPRSPGADAPESLWRARPRPTEAQRRAFRETIEREREALEGEEGEPSSRARARRTERQAITRALVAHGILKVRRDRIPLPIKSKKRAKIC